MAHQILDRDATGADRERIEGSKTHTHRAGGGISRQLQFNTLVSPLMCANRHSSDQHVIDAEHDIGVVRSSSCSKPVPNDSDRFPCFGLCRFQQFDGRVCDRQNPCGDQLFAGPDLHGATGCSAGHTGFDPSGVPSLDQRRRAIDQHSVGLGRMEGAEWSSVITTMAPGGA